MYTNNNSISTHSTLLVTLGLVLYFAAMDLMRSEQFLGKGDSIKFCARDKTDRFPGPPGIPPIAPRLPSAAGLKHPGGREMGGVKAGWGGVPGNEDGVLVRLETWDLGDAEGEGVQFPPWELMMSLCFDLLLGELALLWSWLLLLLLFVVVVLLLLTESGDRRSLLTSLLVLLVPGGNELGGLGVDAVAVKDVILSSCSS